MPNSFTGPAMLAIGFVIVSCAFGQEIHLKTTAIQAPAQTAATLAVLRQSGGNPELSGPAAGVPAGPISISIASPASAVVNVTGSTINVRGTVTGGAGITRVTWQTSDGATGVATGVSSWVASGIPVLRGTTTVTIRAYDSRGVSNWVALVAAPAPAVTPNQAD